MAIYHDFDENPEKYLLSKTEMTVIENSLDQKWTNLGHFRSVTVIFPLQFSSFYQNVKSGIMFVPANINHSKNWTQMDTVIFNLGIFGLHFVQFLSFILYFETDSDRPWIILRNPGL